MHIDKDIPNDNGHGVHPCPERGTHHLPLALADHCGSGTAASGQINPARPVLWSVLYHTPTTHSVEDVE